MFDPVRAAPVRPIQTSRQLARRFGSLPSALGIGPGSLAAVRAAVARRGSLFVEDVDDPVLGPGDALVAVKACGICGSDLHALHFADELIEITREVGQE